MKSSSLYGYYQQKIGVQEKFEKFDNLSEKRTPKTLTQFHYVTLYLLSHSS